MRMRLRCEDCDTHDGELNEQDDGTERRSVVKRRREARDSVLCDACFTARAAEVYADEVIASKEIS